MTQITTQIITQRFASILLPLSHVFGGVSTFRSYLYRTGVFATYSSKLPVICVGNVTTGGSGKTPFVQFLAKTLIAEGRKPAILLRGYGGTENGPYLLSTEDTAQKVGDEAILHRDHFDAKVPVIVAAKRALGAKLIEDQSLGDVILLDDGYQHFALARNLNILLLDISSQDAINRWKHGKLLPAGSLRESLARACARADAVILVHKWPGEHSSNEVLDKAFASAPTFTFSLQPRSLLDLQSGAKQAPKFLQGKTVGILTAIGSPASFLRAVTELGAKIAHTSIKRDHHYFSSEELRLALEAAGGTLVVTAKDAVKLTSLLRAEPTGFIGQILVLEIEGGINDDAERTAFQSLLQAR